MSVICVQKVIKPMYLSFHHYIIIIWFFWLLNMMHFAQTHLKTPADFSSISHIKSMLSGSVIPTVDPDEDENEQTNKKPNVFVLMLRAVLLRDEMIF